jgi:hypothetical protein
MIATGILAQVAESRFKIVDLVSKEALSQVALRQFLPPAGQIP